MRAKYAALAFALNAAMFDSYYLLADSAASSFWQMWCKVSVYGAFLLLYVSHEADNRKTWVSVSLTAATFFNAAMLTFYLIAFFTLNFFDLAINNPVGYVFTALTPISALVALSIRYKDKIATYLKGLYGSRKKQ